MKYEVYHQEPYNPSLNKEELIKLAMKWPYGYIHVAEVETEDDLEKVFRLTNHVYGNWWNNIGVRRVGKETRSTAVGDLVLTQKGELHMVMPFGFQKVRIGITM